MAENRRGKDSRYYLSRGQMIILGGTFTLASIVVFLIGMMVGKELEERKLLKKDEPLVKMPVKPAGGAAGTSGDAHLRQRDSVIRRAREGPQLPHLNPERPGPAGCPTGPTRASHSRKQGSALQGEFCPKKPVV